MAQVETFRNCASGLLWSANPGSPAHARMAAGVGRGEFERVTAQAGDKPKTKTAPRRSRKADESE